MAYYATAEGSNYAVYQNGQRVSTTSAAGLGGFGLDTNNLGSSSQSAPATQPPTTTPAPQTPAPQTPAPQTPAPQTPTSTVNQGRTPVTLGNGQQVFYDKTGAAYDAKGAAVSNATISTSTINNPVTPPTGGGTPTPPNANAPTLADQFNTSLSATLASQQSQLQDALKTQQANYQTQIDAMKQQASDAQNMESMGLSNEQSTVAAETAAKTAALEQEKQQFQQNYDTRQKLTDQLQTLLTTGQSIIQQMKGTTGLSSIMSPRISQTMTDVQGQAGVITAALAASSEQIGLAQSQLKTSLDAISSIYTDQVDYWKNVISFYDNQVKTDNAQVASLSKDQSAYIDAQIKTLQDNVTNTQKTAEYLQNAMLDPAKALTFAKAGVSLTDTPAQINQKLATYEKSQQYVWSAPKLVGGDYIQTNKITGETRTSVANVPTGAAAGNYSFIPTVKTQLAGAGETSATITQLQADIGKYGAQYVLDNGQGLSAATKQIIETEFNIQPTAAPDAKGGLFGLGFLGL